MGRDTLGTAQTVDTLKGFVCAMARIPLDRFRHEDTQSWEGRRGLPKEQIYPKPSWMRQYESAVKNPRKKLLNMVKARAKLQEIPFDLTIEDFVIPETCPILGIPLDRRDRNHTPSVDRLVPELGYTKGNMRIISMRANRLKQDATIEEVEKILRYMQKELAPA